METVAVHSPAPDVAPGMTPRQKPDGDPSTKRGLNTIGYYKSVLSKGLDPAVFEPYPLRMVWFFVCGFGALGLLALIVHGPFGWFGKLLCGIGIGMLNGAMSFINHELLHGSVVKSKRLQTFFGIFAGLPLLVSPTFWRFWHNRVHHGHTQALITDPDAFPTLRVFRNSKFVQAVFPYTPGSGHKRSIIYFFAWFSFHIFASQVYGRFRNGTYEDMDHKRVTWEWILQVTIMLSLAIYAGPSNFIWAVVIPFMGLNYFTMSYIATNHNLNPLTPVNDPLVNSLTVTNHPLLEYLHLNFGYHVEHHIFPTINGVRIKAVHYELLKKFPDTYKIMPKWKAMIALYKTPRVYKNYSELIHPETLKTYPTI